MPISRVKKGPEPPDTFDSDRGTFEEPDCEIIPVGCVLTMVGTGSEMNAGAVITNHETKMKIGHVYADENIMPKFSVLNPNYTLTLPHYQMVSGIYDIFNHICEQYFPAGMIIQAIISARG